MKKFNWKEFGLYCLIGALIGLITSVIHEIARFFGRKRAIKKMAEAKERAREIQERNEKLKAQEEELKQFEKQLEEFRAKMRQSKLERQAINEELIKINAQIDRETDANKLAELQEEQRRLLSSLVKKNEV